MEIDVNTLLSKRNNFSKYSNVKSLLIKGKHSEQRPKFSIIIPTFKRVSTLIETLDSAFKQDYNEYYEIIICDNNPERNDETEVFMSSITDERVIYYKNCENIGMTGNWNRCIELSRGEKLIMLHDDDLLKCNYLFEIDDIFKKNPDIQFLAVNSDELKGQEYIKNYGDGTLSRIKLQNFLFGNIISIVGIVFDREEILKIGGFDEKWYPVMDYYMWCQFAAFYNFSLYAKTLTIYRKECNSSFKKQTLDGFVDQGALISDLILRRFKIPKNIRKMLIYNIQIETIKNIQKNWVKGYIRNDITNNHNNIYILVSKISYSIFKHLYLYSK